MRRRVLRPRRASRGKHGPFTILAGVRDPPTPEHPHAGLPSTAFRRLRMFVHDARTSSLVHVGDPRAHLSVVLLICGFVQRRSSTENRKPYQS